MLFLLLWLLLFVTIILILFNIGRQRGLLTVWPVSGASILLSISCLIEVINIVHEHTIENLLIDTANLGFVVIQFHLLHLLIKLFSLVLCLLLIFLLLLFLLFSLNSLEFIKYVLIV